MTYPTADDVATALVAACQETGESPVDVLTKQFAWLEAKGKHVVRTHFRARHYAFHALALEFSAQSWQTLNAFARLVGVVRTESFLTSTWVGVIGSGKRCYLENPKASWFSYDIVLRVINAVRRGRGLPPTADKFWGPKPAEVFVCESCGGPRSRQSSRYRLCPTCYEAKHRKEKYLRKQVEPVVKPSPSRELVVVSPLPAAPTFACPFKPNDHVCHASYGSGRIVSVGAWNPRRKDYALYVQFERCSHQQMMYSKVLQRAGPVDPAVVARRLEEWSRPLITRHKPTADAVCVSDDLLGTPSLERSALATATPWVPYEQRVAEMRKQAISSQRNGRTSLYARRAVVTR